MPLATARKKTPARTAAPPRVLARRPAPGSAHRWTVDPYPCREADAPPLHLHDHAGPAAAYGAPSLEELLAGLARDLDAAGRGETIAIGATAEPYPAAEKKLGRTRAVLEALRGRDGLDLRIATASNLVARDRALLAELGRRHRVAVEIAIPTLDRRLAKALEPAAPRPDLKLKAVSELAAAGVRAIVLCAPVLPEVNDDPAALDRLARAAAGAGAQGFDALARFFRPAALALFFPHLERELPDRVARYRDRSGGGAYRPEAYQAALSALAARLRRIHGMEGAVPEPPAIPTSQLALF